MPDHARYWWTRRAATLHLLRLLEADKSVAARRETVISGLTEIADRLTWRAPQREVTILPRYQPPAWTLPGCDILPARDRTR